MSTPARRPSSRPTRRAREQRAYMATMVGGGAAVLAVVTAVLAVVGVLSWTIPILLAVVGVIAFVVFRGAVSR